MPNEHGGYRAPAHPAPASGPGRYAKRTDGGAVQKLRTLEGGGYGDTQAMDQLQHAAPMGATAPASAAQAPPMPIDGSALTPLSAPTGQPSVGLLDNLGQMQAQAGPTQIDPQTRERLIQYLPDLVALASQPHASEQTRQLVRQIRADL